MHRRWLAAWVIAAASMAGACASNGSPTSATTNTTPNFAGNYAGTSAVASCTEDGDFTGFCQGVGFVQGATFDTTLGLTQTQAAVTGTIKILGLNGSLQGTASGASGLSATGTLADISNSGVTLNPTISGWTTTLSGNALAGSYKIGFRSSSLTGSSTVSVTIVSLTR